MAESTPAGKRTPWLLIVLLILLLCGGTAAGVYYLVSSGKTSFGNSSAAAGEEKPAPVPAPIFVTIAPFTVNLQGNPGEQRLLYIGLSLKVGDAATAALLKEHMPEVKSRLLMLASSQKADTLVTPDGKQALTAQLLKLFDVPLANPQPPLKIDGVLFSDFIVQ
jgi:flagellar FliL protein